jgi:hypothetical protein
MKMLREIPDDPVDSDWSNSGQIPKCGPKRWGLVLTWWVAKGAVLNLNLKSNLPAAGDGRCARRARLFDPKIIIEKKLPDRQSA